MKKLVLILSSIILTATMLSSCGSPLSENGPSKAEVTIGSQVWTTKNLDVDKFRNGDPIPEAKTREEWEAAGENDQPAWCYLDLESDPNYGEKAGKLYNWYAVNDPRGLAPEGWHIPSKAEWIQLFDYLGGEGKAGTKMKSTHGWKEDGNGSNESGFSAIPGGNRDFYGFGGFLGYSHWWSSTEYKTESEDFRAWRCILNYTSDDNLKWKYVSRKYGCSVRCLRD